MSSLVSKMDSVLRDAVNRVARSGPGSNVYINMRCPQGLLSDALPRLSSLTGPSESSQTLTIDAATLASFTTHDPPS